jgi:tripartite-type tricarboxylate transporter receptor subunit TctC
LWPISGFNLEVWIAMAAPSTTPKAIINRLSAAVAEVVRNPETSTRLLAAGWQAAGSTPEGLAKRIDSDTNTLGGIILMRGIKPQ